MFTFPRHSLRGPTQTQHWGTRHSTVLQAPVPLHLRAFGQSPVRKSWCGNRKVEPLSWCFQLNNQIPGPRLCLARPELESASRILFSFLKGASECFPSPPFLFFYFRKLSVLFRASVTLMMWLFLSIPWHFCHSCGDWDTSLGKWYYRMKSSSTAHWDIELCVINLQTEYIVGYETRPFKE